MNGLPAGREDSQIDHARPTPLDENQRSEVAVARDEQALLILRDLQQFGVFSL